MGVSSFIKRFLRRPLDKVALEGESIDDYRQFWDNSAVADAENAVAYGLPDIWPSGANDAQMLLAYLSPDAVVLEVGCGIGRILRHVAPLCAELHGVDISAVMVRKAQANLADLANVRLHVGNGYELPFPPATFDLVYSCRVFQHIPKNVVLYYLKEVHRVLKPGARFILQVPNLLEEEHMKALNHFATEHFFKNPYPMYFYTPPEIERMGSFAGFSVEVVNDWLLAVLTKP